MSNTLSVVAGLSRRLHATWHFRVGHPIVCKYSNTMHEHASVGSYAYGAIARAEIGSRPAQRSSHRDERRQIFGCGVYILSGTRDDLPTARENLPLGGSDHVTPIPCRRWRRVFLAGGARARNVYGNGPGREGVGGGVLLVTERPLRHRSRVEARIKYTTTASAPSADTLTKPGCSQRLRNASIARPSSALRVPRAHRHRKVTTRCTRFATSKLAREAYNGRYMTRR